LAEGITKIAMQHIGYIENELFQHGFVGVKQIRVLLINRLDPGRIAPHALGKPCYNGSYRISRHQAGQDEIQYEGENSRDQKPKQLVAKIPSVSLQRTPPRP
jgi:hypothetical protein